MMFKRRTARVHPRREVRVLRAHVMSPRIFWFDFCRALAIVVRILLVAALVAAAAWGLWKGIERGLLNNEEFALQHLVLNENPVLDEARFYATTGIGPEATLFDCDPGTLEAKLSGLPEIAAAGVRREFPGTLEIEIRARQPVAWIAGEGMPARDPDGGMLVDRHDILFPCATGHLPEAAALPVIALGPSAPPPQVGEAVDHPDYLRGMRLFRTARKIDPEAADWIDEIRQHRPWGSLLTTRGGTEATFGHRDIERQVGDLLAALAHARERSARIATIRLVGKRNLPVTFHQPPPPRAIPVEEPPANESEPSDLERLLER
jgi:hypothetical protein